MANTKKIVFLLLLIPLLILAQDKQEKGVYFNSETPYIIQISEILTEHDYFLQHDSTKATYNGDLFYYLEDNDSIRCEIQLRKGQGPAFIVDSFMTEPVKSKNVRNSVYKFSIWMLILNAITAILFFARSS
jgi:hypothetical protein